MKMFLNCPKLLSIAILSAALPACESLAPAPTAAQVEVAQQRWPDATLPSLTQGHQTYVNECSGCHNLPDPYELSVDEWPAVIHEMGSEYAKIPQNEIELITRYVVSVRETPPPKN